MPLKVLGPKGGVIVRRLTDLKRLPSLVKRFGRLSLRPADPDYRAKIVEFCQWGVRNEKDIHYSQARPMERLNVPRQLTVLPRFADCSEWATDAYCYAGAPDPNGENYNGTGYTGTLLRNGKRIHVADAKPGDLVVYGPGTGHHVCVVVEAGPDPLLCSHGQESGPLLIRHSAEQAAQPIPATFLTYL